MTLVIPAFVATSARAETSATQEKKSTSTLVLPERRNVPGKRVALPLGELYIPDYYRADPTTGTALCVFFLGASWCAQQNYYDAHINAPLVTISFKGLGEYGPAFKSPDAFRKVLDSAQEKLAGEGVTSQPVTRICLASFSGGYAAVREILSQPEISGLIQDVLLADSLYPSKLKGPERIDPNSIKPFSDFALEAAAGRKTMWFTQLFPPEPHERGNTTTMAAEYLIQATSAERKWYFDAGPDSAPSTKTLQTNYPAARIAKERAAIYRADKGNFHVIGYAGMTMQDHMEHFYRISELFEKSTLGR